MLRAIVSGVGCHCVSVKTPTVENEYDFVKLNQKEKNCRHVFSIGVVLSIFGKHITRTSYPNEWGGFHD